jgi:hypothetical protein
MCHGLLGEHPPAKMDIAKRGRITNSRRPANITSSTEWMGSRRGRESAIDVSNAVFLERGTDILHSPLSADGQIFR